MARIFITGSSDGLGSIVAQRLVARGHSVVLHARNPVRAEDATKACSGAETVLTGDLSSIEETKKLADDVNKLGTFDCVNAGLSGATLRRSVQRYSRRHTSTRSSQHARAIYTHMLDCSAQKNGVRVE
ncbi:hypothetical protein PMIN03_000305 [Paraphaeosphaeria minitans]